MDMNILERERDEHSFARDYYLPRGFSILVFYQPIRTYLRDIITRLDPQKMERITTVGKIYCLDLSINVISFSWKGEDQFESRKINPFDYSFLDYSLTSVSSECFFFFFFILILILSRVVSKALSLHVPRLV